MRDFGGTTVVPVGEGPEDVVVDAAGRVYTGLADGRIVRVAGFTGPVETVAEVPGRPLGLELLGDDELLVCASDAGLLAVSLADGAVRTLVDRVAGARLEAVNNAAVAADGTIYFTDSSQRFRIPQWRADLVRRTATGRLFRRTPDGAVTELLGGLEFANGVALAADGSWVAVAETGAARVHRVWLTGARAGTAEVFVDDLPGHPDNIALGSDGLVWITLPSPRVAALAAVHRLPAALRALLSMLPPGLQPGPGRTLGVLAVDDRGATVHRFSGEIAGFEMLTGVREAGGRLWFGSLTGSTLATVAL
ncbi:SMP-30/gluconolactonase/LRE family protein [Blastococcus sp. VKM Ac-2987]|uniref:SMP-30/gluconolactonase/LRE family protein n=1 Tax=Blastococcus sp. VKM Ac-2987 TaxID=3004141 RepID=UPI0022AB608B|nr:SMP-30/gluconolactonase/LRE family protein [Blastococcus sp. VKM Ac-2987]MCZ2860393.1 SMP-30/gluconolactonase/LRE family protein [Blastococcus sp. VKM Ac-2987]